MTSTVISILLLIICYIAALLVWHRLRLRRALSVFLKQITWSIKQAPRDKFVLEVGSGNNPHLRADVLCEKYLHDDLHRGAHIALDRPLVIADASTLPFKTDTFDSIMSNHMIEHLEDPRPFFREAGRVAHSGLFLAPNALAEQLYSAPFHLWMIEQKGNRLHFTAKSQPVVNPVLHEFFANEVMNTSLGLDNFLLDHWDSLLVTYSWTGKPECVIEGEPFAPDHGFVQASTMNPTVRHKVTGLENLRAYLKKWIRKAMHVLLSSHRKVDLTEILACPKCHGDVAVSKSEIRCQTCELSFPVEGGIPIMLLDHAIASPSLPVA